jgi:hypothetical protein
LKFSKRRGFHGLFIDLSNIFYRLCCIDRQDIFVQDAQIIDEPPTVNSPNLGVKHLTTDRKVRIIECVVNGESLSAIGAESGNDRGAVGRVVKRWQERNTLERKKR